MEEFRFNLDPEKFKKNLHQNQQEESQSEQEIAEDAEIEKTQQPADDVASEERFAVINMPDVVVFEDEFDIDEADEEVEEDNDREAKKALKAQQRLIKREQAKEKRAAKKQAKLEAKKHKGSNILFYIAFTLLFVIVTTALSLTVFFNIETVQVEGAAVYTTDEIVAASGIQTGDNVFLISSEKIQKNITTALPYVKSVEVKKRLDNKIVLEISETYDYMVVASNSGFAVLSPEKKVLRFIEGSYPNELVHVFGLKVKNVHTGEAAVFDSVTAEKALDDLIPVLINTGFSNTRQINVFDLSSIKVLYNERILLNLGTQTDLEYKLTFAKQAIDTSIEEDAIGTLNLSQLTTKNREIQFRRESFYNVVKTVEDEPLPENATEN